jgi:hypothetical protein
MSTSKQGKNIRNSMLHILFWSGHSHLVLHLEGEGDKTKTTRVRRKQRNFIINECPYQNKARNIGNSMLHILLWCGHFQIEKVTDEREMEGERVWQRQNRVKQREREKERERERESVGWYRRVRQADLLFTSAVYTVTNTQTRNLPINCLIQFVNK